MTDKMGDDLRVALMGAADAAGDSGDWRLPIIKALLEGAIKPLPLVPVYEDRIGRPLSAGPRRVISVRAEYVVEMRKEITISERELAVAYDQEDLVRRHMIWAYREMGVDTTQDLPLGYLPRRQQPLRSPAYGGEIIRVDPQERSQTVGQLVRYDQATGRWAPADSDRADGIVVQAREDGSVFIQAFER